MSNLYSAAENLPLHRAVDAGDISAIEAIIRGGYDIETKDYAERTALNHAVVVRKESTAIALLKAGASCRLPGKFGKSAFHHALFHARKYCPELFRKMLIVDSSLIYFSADESKSNYFPFLYALMQGDADLLLTFISIATLCNIEVKEKSDSSIDLIPSGYTIKLVEDYSRLGSEKNVILLSYKDCIKLAEGARSVLKEKNKEISVLQVVLMDTIENFFNLLQPLLPECCDKRRL